VQLIQIDHTALEPLEAVLARLHQNLTLVSVRLAVPADSHAVALGSDVDLRTVDLALCDTLFQPVADPCLRRHAVVERHWIQLGGVDEVDAQRHGGVELLVCHLLLRVERTPHHRPQARLRDHHVRVTELDVI